MNKQEVKNVLQQKIRSVAALCDKINEKQENINLIQFRNEMRTFRSFLHMLRLYSSNDELRLPSECRKLYSLAKVVADNDHKLHQLSGQLMIPMEVAEELTDGIMKAKADWKKCNTKHAIQRLEKLLLSHDYSRVQPAVLTNFFSTRALLKAVEEEYSFD